MITVLPGMVAHTQDLASPLWSGQGYTRISRSVLAEETQSHKPNKEVAHTLIALSSGAGWSTLCFPGHQNCIVRPRQRKEDSLKISGAVFPSAGPLVQQYFGGVRGGVRRMQRFKDTLQYQMKTCSPIVL